MKRIEQKFVELKNRNEKALVGFITAGDPDYDRSFKIIMEMIKSGLDILELGVPFSDPTADGPFIQRSSIRALGRGMNLGKTLELLGNVRRYSDIPVVIFSYYNPILAYGRERYYEDARKFGADGALIVDLPIEESDEVTSFWDSNDLAFIRLIAPTTPRERIKKIAGNSQCFIYLISRVAVTGYGNVDILNVRNMFSQIRKMTDVPICTGFGISQPSQVKELSAFSDGVVVGSAFEKIIEDNLNNDDAAAMVGDFVRILKNVTKKIA